jgi:uncharacterized protein (TIGR02391 family)
MTAPDMDWVAQRLRQFISMTVPHNLSGGGFITPRSGPAAPETEVIAEAEVLEQILARFYPGWGAIQGSDTYKWHRHREAAIRCLSRIQSTAEVAEHLGDTAPTLSASTLHPWVWDAARSLWNSGHYREAVEAAAKSLNAYTQSKVGRRDISEGALFVQAFSDDAPKDDSPRLRPEGGHDGGKSAASLRRGIRDYASGCYAAIRNPKAHDDPNIDTPEHEALEQLAAFSVLARWVDRATQVTS